MAQKKETKQKLFTIGEVKSLKGDIVVIASDETVDRDGEVIKVSGWELKNYKKVPTMLVLHDYSRLPVGVWEVWVEDDKLMARAKFASTEQAKEVETLVREGILRAVSVGFIIKKRNEEESTIIEKAELLEISWVSVPANPNAVVQLMYKGFTPTCETKSCKTGKLLEHYREVIPVYRKMLKEIAPLVGVDLKGIDDETQQIEKLAKVLTDQLKTSAEPASSEVDHLTLKEVVRDELVKAFKEII